MAVAEFYWKLPDLWLMISKKKVGIRRKQAR